MSNPLLTSESCAVGVQTGMVTSWTIAGAATAYAGTLTTTDGYTLEASLTMKAFTSSNTAGTLNCDTNACTIGTCVETYDSAGVVVAATVTDDGNLALCHWFLVAANAAAVYGTAGAVTSGGNDYSVAYYLTATQWGTAGNALVGNGLTTRGTAIGTTHGFTRDPTTKPSTVYTNTTYKQKWFQPTYAATYASTALRRYNGGSGDADRVKAYCAMLRDVATASTAYSTATALKPATVGGTSGVVTLTGAQALAAGAIAFGVAALAF
jgi:hypothetical protein